MKCLTWGHGPSGAPGEAARSIERRDAAAFAIGFTLVELLDWLSGGDHDGDFSPQPGRRPGPAGGGPPPLSPLWETPRALDNFETKNPAPP